MAKPESAKAEVLSGWKEIAAYLGKGVRTVQRYERDLSLPVRRPSAKSTGAVIATKAELDGWIAAAPFRKKFQLSHESTAQIHMATRAALDELNHQVQELRELRQQSAALRQSLHESVHLLRKTISSSLIEKSVPEPTDLEPGPSKKVH